MKKKKDMTEAYLALLRTVTVVCILVGSLKHIGGWIAGDIAAGFFGRRETPRTEERAAAGAQYWDADEIAEVRLELALGGLRIVGGEEYALSWRGYPTADSVESRVEEGVLIVEQEKAYSLFSGGVSADCSVTLTVPREALPELTISLGEGELELERTALGTLEAEVEMGSATIEGCELGEATITAEMGSVTLEDTRFESGSFRAEMGSVNIEEAVFTEADCVAEMGSIYVSGAFQRLTAECEMGSVTVVSDEEDASVELSAEMGSVSYNGEDHGRAYRR